jgi:hypothetical protein
MLGLWNFSGYQGGAMKTYEVELQVRYVKRYIANSPEEATEAMEFDYMNLYIDEEMCEPGTPKIFDFSWEVLMPDRVKNDKTIYARDVRGILDEEAL